MTEFVFLYRECGGPISAEERERVMPLWMAWLQKLADDGHLVDRGRALQGAGRIVGAKAVTDGPFTETKEVIGGFTLIRANDLAQASALAGGCPILARGGSVEVRPVLKLD